MLSVIQHLQTPKHLFMSCCLLNTSSSVMFPCVKRVFVPGQMLNCCIERKKARDESHKVPEGKEKEHRVSGACQKSRQGPECATSASSSTREMSQGKSWDSWSDSEEEFFECLSDQGETEATQAEGRAEGRLHPYNNMTAQLCRASLCSRHTGQSHCLTVQTHHMLLFIPNTAC